MVPNWPNFQGPFGLEWGQNCSKWAQNGLIPIVCGPPNNPKVCFEKHTFHPFLTHFWSQNSPFSRHFVTLQRPKWLAMGSKRAHFTCSCTPNGLGSVLENPIFDPFVTHFWSQNSPFSRHFGIFRRATTGHHELKTRQKHFFWHSMWSRIIFEKSHFFAPGGPC